MKKIFLVAAINCLLVFTANSQTRTRYFDNFDTSSGVQITQPAAFPAPAKNKKGGQTSPANSNSYSKDGSKNNKFIKKTVQQTMAMQDAVSLKNSPNSGGMSIPKLSMSSGSSMGGFTTGDDLIDSYILNSCAKYAVDPLLIYSQMHQESSFKLKATSNKGARGLMQLMPGTAARFGVSNIYDPKQNIEGGVKYMRWLLDTFGGDVNLALAGYNAGEGAVIKYGYVIPPYNETQEYVRRISNRYNSIRNPNFVKTAVKQSSPGQIARLEKKAPPLTVYERNPLAVRMPDGRMRLVNQ